MSYQRDVVERSKVVAKKAVPFSRLSPKEEDQVILKCLKNEIIVVNNTSNGKNLLMPEDLQCIASISDSIRDSYNIGVYRIESYFSKVAWENTLISPAKFFHMF